MNPPQVSPRDEAHQWTQRRLATATAGLLTDTEEERFRAHLADCDACGEAWREQSEAMAGAADERGPQGERHLPPAMVARWPEAARNLQGLERESVRRHLERCADCRADLKAQGHQSVLAAPVVTLPPRRRSFGAGLSWGMGLTAVAALAAGLMLPIGSEQPNALLPWVAPVTLRGNDPATLTLPADAAAFTILANVPTGLDGSRSVDVTVFSPAGTAVLEAEVPPELQAARTLSLVIKRKQDVQAGLYRVVFTQAGADGQVKQHEVTFLVTFPVTFPDTFPDARGAPDRPIK